MDIIEVVPDTLFITIEEDLESVAFITILNTPRPSTPPAQVLDIQALLNNNINVAIRPHTSSFSVLTPHNDLLVIKEDPSEGPSSS